MKKKVKACFSEGKCDDCGGGCAYFLGVIGTAVYYLGVTTGFWASVVALLKSLVWPAFLVYEVLKFVGA
jgi:hypothetical protein